MQVEITTTIVTKIDSETLKASHEATIEKPEGMPEDMAIAAVAGGMRSSLLALGFKSKLKRIK